MAERIRYLVMYDIRDPKRLRRVHEVAVDFGERLQYSVYVCDLTRQQLVGFRAKVRAEMHLREDSLSIFDLGPAAGRVARRVEHVGRPPTVADGGPTGDAVIW
jgi:CRISPR-associated protein Cas2